MEIERPQSTPNAPDRSPQTPMDVPLRSRRAPVRRAPESVGSKIRWQPLRVNFDEATGFHSGPVSRRKGYVLAAWNWLASVIDILILISATSLFLLVFAALFQQPPSQVIASIRANQNIYQAFTEIFLLSAWVYMVAMRAFMGATVGEWACDIRLGSDSEKNKSGYLIRVAARESIMTLTGLVILPLVSLIIARDFVGNLIGLRLMSLK